MTDAATDPVLLVEHRGAVVIVTLNRPQAMNALSRELRARLHSAFVELDADESVSVIVLTGAGRAFTAGLDLKELGRDGLGAANAEGADENPVLAIEQCRKPVIGAINGVAITGGFEVALACDVLIASEAARFADTHARVGIMPGWGLSANLPRILGPSRAKALSLTGNFLDAKTAQAWGLVNEVVASDALLPTALKLAEDMATIPAETLMAYKRILDEVYAQPFGEALKTERRLSLEHNRQVTPQMVEARREAIQARGRIQR